MDLDWELADPRQPGIWVIRIDGIEVARVNARADSGWMSEVGRHRQDWRRRLHIRAPSKDGAKRWAMLWTHAHLPTILSELPRNTGKFLEWPASNPLFDWKAPPPNRTYQRLEGS